MNSATYKTDAASMILNRPQLAEAGKHAVQPLAYRKRSAALLLDISVRHLERLLAAGQFPKPDARAGRCPLWTRTTLEAWLSQGGGTIVLDN